MTGFRATTLLGVVAGLLAAFVANSAHGAIILGSSPFADMPEVAGGLKGWSDGAGPVEPEEPDNTPHPSNEGENGPSQPALLDADGVAAGCTTSSQPGPSSSGFGSSAIASASCSLPQPSLLTTLPREARPYLPTGPPFELLRPPRFCFDGSC
ncbi:MAG: hypothetical protein ACYTG0_19690 [Planctomycetota bacterium]|jgi:hypothetical protein